MADLDHTQSWLDALKWDADGMIPAIAQDEGGRIVMFAWMSRESLVETLHCGNGNSAIKIKIWRYLWLFPNTRFFRVQTTQQPYI